MVEPVLIDILKDGLLKDRLVVEAGAAEAKKSAALAENSGCDVQLTPAANVGMPWTANPAAKREKFQEIDLASLEELSVGMSRIGKRSDNNCLTIVFGTEDFEPESFACRSLVLEGKMLAILAKFGHLYLEHWHQPTEDSLSLLRNGLEIVSKTGSRTTLCQTLQLPAGLKVPPPQDLGLLEKQKLGQTSGTIWDRWLAADVLV